MAWHRTSCSLLAEHRDCQYVNDERQIWSLASEVVCHCASEKSVINVGSHLSSYPCQATLVRTTWHTRGLTLSPASPSSWVAVPGRRMSLLPSWNGRSISIRCIYSIFRLSSPPLPYTSTCPFALPSLFFTTSLTAVSHLSPALFSAVHNKHPTWLYGIPQGTCTGIPRRSATLWTTIATAIHTTPDPWGMPAAYG